MIDEQLIPQHPRPQASISTIFLVSASVLVALALAAFAFILSDFGRDLRDLDRATTTPPLVETTSQPPSERGIITGSLAYPSEFIPEDMFVCAVNQQSGEETCTSNHLATTEEPYGVNYRLEVPAGIYLVYAQLPSQSQKAYYSEFVTCGLSAECPSHEPIPVEVGAGETVNNVDPHDWYVSES